MGFQILVVEDDSVIQQAMKTFLEKEGYDVLAVNTGEDAISAFKNSEFHLILLDMMLPKMNGEKVLTEVRRLSPNQPVVIISALGDEFIQLDAFSKEIEDYVVKPFSMNILLYKISIILKRIYGENQKIIEFEDILVYVDQYEVYKKKELVNLTPKEFEILQVMLINSGKVYSREELLLVVWGHDYLGVSRTIDVHIKNIRKKLQTDIIKTIKGVGYKVEKIL